MHRIAAELRHRELTQELYDIGDELATYLENLAAAIADWDAELAADCLAELDEIVTDARIDARTSIGELIGLRQALTSGVRAGRLSARGPAAPAHPEPVLPVLEVEFPLRTSPIVMSELTGALSARTEATVIYLSTLVGWILQATERAATDLEALSLPHAYHRVGELAHAAVVGWQDAVIDAHPAYARAMRGNQPPEFLAERAWLDAVMAKVAAKRERGTGAAS